MDNISKINDCYGCGVCATVCAKKIIKIHLNRDGFYEPYIDQQDKCTKCRICLDVCALNHNDLSLEENNVNSWAAWSNDEKLRRECSSGGVGFEIARTFIEKGYKVVACRYNVEKVRAEHYIATTVKELAQSIGSKYIQSYTLDAFKEINRKEKYLVVGTPCQIDSFRRYIKRFNCEDNFVLMDFFCHCVPSMHAWRAYTKMQEKKVGKITYASWRNKSEYGWHDSYNLLLKGEKSFIQSRKSQGDLFYKLFLGDMCLGPQCSKQCKYKYDKSSADIRIGDIWGNTYKDNEEGVSALISFTEKGRQAICDLHDVTLIEHPFEVVAEGQMKKNAEQRELTPLFRYMLRNGWRLDGIPFMTILFIQRVVGKIVKLL